MASLVTDNNPIELDPIKTKEREIRQADERQTLKGLKPEYFGTWKPLEDNRINAGVWSHGRYPLARWGPGTYSNNKFKLHTCDGVVQRIGFYDDNRLRRWGNEVRKTGNNQYMVMKCIPCPHGKGYITRGPMNDDKLPRGWGVFQVRPAMGQMGDPYEIKFTYCPHCIQNQMRYKSARFTGHRNILDPNSDMLGRIRINPTAYGQSWLKPLYDTDWLHVGRRKQYVELDHTEWRNRIIGITENVTPLMIKDVINTHDSSKTEHPNLPIKFCVNFARCGNSFYRNKPPRWQTLENGFKCQPCFEMHKMSGETTIDFTKRGRPDQQRNVRALPLTLAREITKFGQGGRRRKYRKKRTKKRTKKRRKKRTKKRRKKNRKKRTKRRR
jgi:hypothetical protein